jgi:hypothetical protein
MLEVYVVWEPIRDDDNEKAARDATLNLVDHRARHFWVNDLAISDGFKKPLGLDKQTAWDVYLLFPPGATWGANPPTPAYFMDMDRSEMPADRRLNGIKLAQEIAKLLPAR